MGVLPQLLPLDWEGKSHSYHGYLYIHTVFNIQVLSSWSGRWERDDEKRFLYCPGLGLNTGPLAYMMANLHHHHHTHTHIYAHADVHTHILVLSVYILDIYTFILDNECMNI